MKTVLEIKDEVNIKFHGVDVATRRKLSDALKYFLPHAYHTPAYKLGRWDGCVRLCDIGARSYFNLLDKLLPIVVENGYEVEVDDQRQQWDLQLSKITEDHFSHKKWPKGHPAEGEPIMFRDYQIDIVNRFMDNPQCVQEIATGAGKTLMTAALSNLVEPMGRSIVIVPNKDLVTQTEQDYRNLGLDVGVYFGDRKEFGHTHTICTWQSLDILEKKTKAGEAPIGIDEFIDGVVCIMVDEVHKAKADVLRNMLSGIFAHCPIRWGLTGTIPEAEHEAVSITATIGPVVGNLKSKELQEQGVLAKLEIDVIQTQDAPLEFKSYAQELKWLTTDTKRVKTIGDMVAGISTSGNTLVLVDRIKTGEMLIEMNPDWVFISGTVKGEDRKSEYDQIQSATNKVIVATYGVAAVGINIPRIFNLVLYEPGKSYVRVIQSIGRGIRKAKDKDFVQVYDITSNLKYSKRHLTKRKSFYKDQGFNFRVVKLNKR